MPADKPKEENRLQEFEDLLGRLSGGDLFPLEMVGDLDDLGFTLEKAAAILNSLVAGRSDLCREELEAKFYQLEILLDQDLPWILKDLLPAMKRFRERAADS